MKTLLRSSFGMAVLICAPALLVWSTFAAVAQPSAKATIERSVIQDAALPGGATFWVVFKDEADLSDARRAPDWASRGQLVHDRLRSVADKSQARMRGILQSKGAQFRPFWILNTVQVKGGSALLNQIASLPEVKEIVAERVLKNPEIQAARYIPSVGGVEWNLHRIKAPVVWSNYLATGQGIVVCNIDTGVQYDHPALVNHYRGKTPTGFDHNYNWFEPTSATALPYPHDVGGHGTHTMGTMVGGTGPDNMIGVAPGATWIAAKACAGSTCDFADLMACAQWILAPTDLSGNNPMPSLRPNIVNNSWGIEYSDPWFRGIVHQWVMAGIFPVFSAGNSGELGCFTVNSPADYPDSYAVGAFDYDNNLSWFSSIGPALDGEIKPNIAAPGSDIRSAFPGSAYALASGTSMAAPHVAGAVALLWSAAPSLKGNIEATRDILNRSAVDAPGEGCGGAAGNNTLFGEGFLDVSRAVALAPLGTAGSLSGFITNASTGLPVPGAQVSIRGPVSATVLSAPNGAYKFPAIPVGTYEISVSSFGLLPIQNVPVVVNGFNTLNFVLEPAMSSYSLSGTVRDNFGEPVVGAKVHVHTSPTTPVYTAADGAYSFPSLPEGTYTVWVDPTCCYDSGFRELQLTNNVSGFDFAFAAHTDLFGYRCTVIAPAYVEATASLGLFGDDFYITTNLPFAFTFYGKQYTNITISCDGHVQLGAGFPQPLNNAIPSSMPPNAAIYAFWDDLWIGSTNTVRFATNGTSPNRRYIIEWRGVNIHSSSSPIDFEIVLEESGRILCQYRNLPDTPLHRGGAATFGIENEDGSLALQFGFNEPVLESSDFAIEYWPAPAATIHGRVTDANDGQPIALAQVELTQLGHSRRVTTGLDGSFMAQMPLGAVEISANAYNYVSSNAVVLLDIAGASRTNNFPLHTPVLAVSPNALHVQVAQGKGTSATLTLSNAGQPALEWSLSQLPSAKIAGTARRLLNPLANSDSTDTRGVFLGAETAAWPAQHGDVLASFAPTGMVAGWGLALLSNTLAISEASPATNTSPDVFFYTLAGAQSGFINTLTNGWAADMAYDSRHHLICQVRVGGTGPAANSIVCSDPATGALFTNITGAWAITSQRGLAYRPDDDTFYVGGWNAGKIYQIKGLSWDAPGAVLREITPDATSIAGLAWNAAQHVLWISSNELLDRIYALDTDSGAILATIMHPSPGYNGAGLECDPSGRLWVASQEPNRVYLIDTRLRSFAAVPWLSASITNGVINRPGTQPVQLAFNGSTLSPGTYTTTLYLDNNGGKTAQTSVPVDLRVYEEAYAITNVSGGTVRSDFGGWVGVQYQVGVKARSIIALGRYVLSGNSRSHELRLIRGADAAVLGSVQVDLATAVPGTFARSPLPAPVLLEPGTIFYVVSKELFGGDTWLDVDTTVQSTSVAQVLGGVYSYSGSTFFLYGQQGHGYVPVDFAYEKPPLILRTLQIIVSAPAPSAQTTVTLTPSDYNGAGTDVAPFSRSYADGSLVAISAPAAQNGAKFTRWEVGGAEFSTFSSITLGITNNIQLTAVYTALPFDFTNYVRTVTPGTLRQDFSGSVGYKFRTGSKPISLFSLGRWRVEGSAQTHLVKIVKATDFSDIPGAAVVVDAATGPTNAFQYAPLENYVTLAPDTEYLLVSREFAGGDRWLDCTTTLATTDAAQTLSGAYAFGNSLPYYFFCTGSRGYGPVDFQYIPTSALRIAALGADGPANIIVDLPDTTGAIGGNAPYSLVYSQGTAIALSAAAQAGTAKFIRWNTNGVQFSTSRDITWAVNGDASLTAIYGPVKTLVYSNYLGTLRNDFTGAVGTRLRTGVNSLKVTALGRIKALGNTGTHVVKLVNAATGADVPGAVVSVSTAAGNVGQFVYEPLAAPVVLEPNALYHLVSMETAGGDKWHDVDSVIHTTSAADALGGIYAFGASTVYYSYKGAGFSYGLVDLKYEGLAEWQVTVASSNAAPASITVSLPDNLGRASGAPPFTRSYTEGAQLTLTAPGVANERLFQAWLLNGVQVTTNPALALTVGGPSDAVALYNSAPTTTTNLVASITPGSPRNDFGGWVGARITVGSNAMNVVALGRIVVSGNTGGHIVKVVDAATGLDVLGAQANINTASGSAGGFVYSELPEPVKLPRGGVYYVLSQESLGGDYWYDVNSSVVPQPNSASIDTGAYGFRTGFWYLFGSKNRAYVPVDLKYYLD